MSPEDFKKLLKNRKPITGVIKITEYSNSILNHIQNANKMPDTGEKYIPGLNSHGHV